jgi:hypothetical protein
MTVDLTRLVRPLEWRELRDGNHRKGECFSTRSPVSFSPISVHKKHDGWWLNVDCRTYPDLDAAQAAANADNAARVLAAIDTALIAELVEALESIATKSYYAKGPGNTAQTVATAAIRKLNGDK